MLQFIIFEFAMWTLSHQKPKNYAKLPFRKEIVEKFTKSKHKIIPQNLFTS